MRQAAKQIDFSSADTTWIKQATIYEVMIRAFFDSNDDGIGDIKGITQKLDYLEWLGIDCIWLLPFYQSPLRDGGYDISDYKSVLPEFGTVEDVRELVEGAHQRGIRVLADMVMNHTSDEHPWFIESASSRDNPKADWYVWSDDDKLYDQARVICVDTQKSNWEWHPVRRQYYWHRFDEFQPDLNFENAEVQAELLSAARFWYDIGLDGLRLDAIPYLFEDPETNCENDPRGHEFLKWFRAEIEKTHPGRVMLAEACQPPNDVVDYYGDGDECHMAFHFPVMPRMYMAVRNGLREPIVEALADTPDIPDNCQWGMFLRNHDELTLEMVSEEERAYMYAEYCPDPLMRRQIGIRRRLLSLLENDRRVAELLHSLIFSFPGTPVMYYGDEIGMGDNIYLYDRDSVRTPMQWSPDRNAGFSRADWAKLYLPPLMDPVYGYQQVNVESQVRNRSSFLHWLRRLISIRQRYSSFGEGNFRMLEPENPSVLAFYRRRGDEIVLCVSNMSERAQPTQLELQQFSGLVPVEMLGRVPFPPIGELPYFLTLAPYQFYWLQLTKRGS